MDTLESLMDVARLHIRTVPSQAVDDVRLERFTISEEQAKIARIRSFSNPVESMRVPESGEYVKLYVGKTLMMSDTRAEIRDLWALSGLVLHGQKTHRRGLITGLGLGCAVGVVFATDPEVEIVVVEKSWAVANIVEPLLRRNYPEAKLSIVIADAYTWNPPKGMMFDWAWHDIWPDMSSENLPEMGKLRRHYARRVAAGEQRCWAESICRYAKSRGY